MKAVMKVGSTKTQENLAVAPLLIDLPTICRLISISDRKIRGMVSAGEFPKPLKIGRCSRWRAVDVEKWIAQLN